MTAGSDAGGSDRGVSREWAVERVEGIVSTVESEPMPVPVREVWVYGDVALGLDPVERLNVYVTKDLLFKGDADREGEFVESHGVEGVGKTVSAEWVERHPEYLRANANGHAAPEQCLAAHLLEGDEPVHLEVCNAGFENNVTQRLEGAKARDDWTELLDPRAACLWVATEDGGRRSEEAFRKLREGEFVFPTLPDALEMLGLEDGTAEAAAAALREYRASQEGATVRGDVV
jgi:hypothetical protein